MIQIDEHGLSEQHASSSAPPAQAAGDAPRLALNEGDVRKGLGKLILTLVEFLRQLLERQAVRRMEAGSLDDQQIERIGRTFLELSEQIERLKKEFCIEGEELNLDLGPLGKLM